MVQNRKSGLDLDGSKTVFSSRLQTFLKEISKWLPKTPNNLGENYLSILAMNSRETWHPNSGHFRPQSGCEWKTDVT